DALHAVGEVLRLMKALMRHHVDQQLHRLVDRLETSDGLAADGLYDLVRCRNDQFAVLDMVVPSDCAARTNDKQAEKSGDVDVERKPSAAAADERPSCNGASWGGVRTGYHGESFARQGGCNNSNEVRPQRRGQ